MLTPQAHTKIDTLHENAKGKDQFNNNKTDQYFPSFVLVDQNRNKTSKSTSASSSLKRSTSNQPDVVTNSVAPTSGAAEEIARLEALCETRTKQLNIARMQLRASAQGFDAMTVLVRYLNEEVSLLSLKYLSYFLERIKFILNLTKRHHNRKMG